MSTLNDLIEKKKEIEEIFKFDEVTEELEQMWNDNKIAIADKIDRYGFVLEDMETAIKEITDRKKMFNSRIKTAVERIEKEIQKIKGRLNYFSEGKALKGNIYSFHPYISKETKVPDLTLVENKYKRFNLGKLSYKEFSFLAEILTVYVPVESNKEAHGLLLDRMYHAEEDCLKSELPDGHPALKVELKPSVRVS